MKSYLISMFLLFAFCTFGQVDTTKKVNSPTNIPQPQVQKYVPLTDFTWGIRTDTVVCKWIIVEKKGQLSMLRNVTIVQKTEVGNYPGYQEVIRNPTFFLNGKEVDVVIAKTGQVYFND